VLPEEHRSKVFSQQNPFSVGTVLVGGQAAASWAWRDESIVVQPWRELTATERDELESERAGLEAFHR
jgi:hypothetical protein